MKDSGYWYAIRLALVGIAWNTDNVTPSQSASITSVQSLTSPAWKGKLGVIDPNGGGVDYLPWYLWDTDSQLGTPFLTKLAANKPRVYSSTTAASDALASGDISVLVNGSETGLEPLADKSAPIQWKFTSPAWGLPTGQAITAKAPHPSAAELFQDYSLSAVGAALFQAQGGAPARTGLSDQRAIAKQSWYHLPTSVAPYDEQVAVKDQSQILSMFQSLFG
jgi:iron(III) transport system substrate-binding protein